MLWPGWFVTSSLRYAARPQAAGCQLSAASTVGDSTSAYQNAVGRPSSTWFTSNTAAIGIIVAVLNQLLIRSGREDQAMMTTLAGLVVVLSILVKQISALFVTIKSLFSL